MSLHLSKAIDNLKRMVLQLATLAEEQLGQAIRSLRERNSALAREVSSRDSELDDMEVSIEEECLKILALYQPVALDLRFVVSVLKINNELERIGDLAQNIAYRTPDLGSFPVAKEPFDVSDLADKVKRMVKDSIDALIRSDSALARKVCEADQAVNRIHRGNFKIIREHILREPSDTGHLLEYLSVSRYLERIADAATNVAEDVIYLVEGNIVRHHI